MKSVPCFVIATQKRYLVDYFSGAGFEGVARNNVPCRAFILNFFLKVL